jgi:hypothetical protein
MLPAARPPQAHAPCRTMAFAPRFDFHVRSIWTLGGWAWLVARHSGNAHRVRFFGQVEHNGNPSRAAEQALQPALTGGEREGRLLSKPACAGPLRPERFSWPPGGPKRTVHGCASRACMPLRLCRPMSTCREPRLTRVKRQGATFLGLHARYG